MRIHCTKSLAELLKKAGHTVSADTDRVTSLSFIGSWHANVCTIQRKRCVVLCHDQTRFILTLPFATQKDLQKIDFWFDDLFVNTLLKSGIAPQIIEHAASGIASLEFDTKCDRSVQGTLNQVIQELKFMVEYDGLSMDDFPLYSMGVHLSQRPCRIKGMKETECIFPIHEMASLLKRLPQTTSAN